VQEIGQDCRYVENPQHYLQLGIPGAGQIGAAVWAPPIGRHHLGAHRLGDGT